MPAARRCQQGDGRPSRMFMTFPIRKQVEFFPDVADVFLFADPEVDF